MKLPSTPPPSRNAPGIAKQPPEKNKSSLQEFAWQAGEEVAKQYWEQLLRQQQQQNRQQSNPQNQFPPETRRFPEPHLVQPLPGAQPLIDPETGIIFVPNNYGGLSFYASNGAPLGFTAVHLPTGELHLFDPFGNRLR
ncbi:MAG: hypothetical protein NZM31_04480 [Gemmatales bacterium]|nr:hypothetical protein [Gemmatales bacterium]MDW8386257.1 hypothetical protein [Gemmatales bacterium]